MGKIKVPTPYIVKRLNRQKNESGTIRVDGLPANMELDNEPDTSLVPEISVGGAETIRINVVTVQDGPLPSSYSSILKFTDFEPLTTTNVYITGDEVNFESVYVVCDDNSTYDAISMALGLKPTSPTNPTAIALKEVSQGKCSFTIVVDSNGIPHFKGLDKSAVIPIPTVTAETQDEYNTGKVVADYYASGAIAGMGLKYDITNLDFKPTSDVISIITDGSTPTTILYIDKPIRLLEDTVMYLEFYASEIHSTYTTIFEVENGAVAFINNASVTNGKESTVVSTLWNFNESTISTKPVNLIFYNFSIIEVNSLGSCPESNVSTFETHFKDCSITIFGTNGMTLNHKHLATFENCALQAITAGIPLFIEPELIGSGAKLYLVDVTTDTNLSLVGYRGSNPNTIRHGILEYVQRGSADYVDVSVIAGTAK